MGLHSGSRASFCRSRSKASVSEPKAEINRAKPPASCRFPYEAVENYRTGNARSLFAVDFLGRGFNSRRLHHDFMESRYVVSLKKTDEGYSVWVPGLPGCWSQGATEEDALDNIRDAIREYVSVARELASEGEVREVALTL